MKPAISLFVAALVIGCALPGDARPGHGGAATPVVPISCPYSIDNGCADAPPGAAFINPSAFATARQSGQAQYKNASGIGSNHPSEANLPGVDYAVGSTIADADLLDPSVNVPSGCTWSAASLVVRCTSGADIEGYRFYGKGIYTTGGSLYTLKNNHFTVDAVICRGYFNGLAPVYDHNLSFTSDWVVENNTFDFDPDCSPVANTYKTAADPGLVQQSSENISIASNVLTINSSVTGTIRVGQYLDYAGKPTSGNTSAVRLGTNITPGGITSCSGAGCSGTTWNVCAKNLNGSGGTIGGCYAVVVDQAAVDATTGPVESDIAYAVGAGRSLSAKYNYSTGWGDLAGMGGAGGLDVRYNYSELFGVVGQHQNYVQSQPSPGTASTIPYYRFIGNFLFYNSASPPIGTSLLGEFTASPSSATSTGYQITTTKFEAKDNVLISNTSDQTGSYVAAALLRYLSQGSTVANVSFTLSGGVATVTFNSGSALAVGQYLPCVAANGCTKPIPITSLGTGTGGSGTYNTSNSTDTVTSTTGNTRWYPGEIGTIEWTDNWMDKTGTIGANSIYSTDSNVVIGTTIISGNRSLLTGGSCDSNGSC